MPITDRVQSDLINDDHIADHLRIARDMARAKNYEVLLFLCSMALEELRAEAGIADQSPRVQLRH